MPHEWNNIIVVTKDELVPAWYSTWASLKLALHRYKDNLNYGIKRARIGGGGHELLIKFDSLPPHIQDGLGDPRKVDHILERYYKIIGEAVTYFSTFKFDDGSYLAVEHQEKYIVNASVLQAIIHLRAARITERLTKGGSLKRTKTLQRGETISVPESLCLDAASFNKTLLVKHKVTHSLPASEKRFNPVLKAFESTGFKSLISAKHKNDNSRKVTAETLTLLNNMFGGDKTKPTATEVHRRYDDFIHGRIEIINNNTGELYDPAEFKKLSDGTVKKYMASWVNQIATFAKRSGNRQLLMQKFKPHHSLDRPKYAGSIISVDDRQPPFKALDGKRVWFYNAIDLGSEAFTCWVYGRTKEGIIKEFYQQLVRNYAAWGFNLPAELEAELSLNSSFTETFLREGAMFQHVRIEANNARGKRIERYYGSLRYETEKHRKGWIARPFALSESNQAGPHQVPMLPYNEIIEGCLEDIVKWNNSPHAVHTHMSRWEVFCQMQNPDLQPTNYIAILPHIGFKTPTSCRVGIIRLQNQEFLLGDNGKVSLGQKLITLMKQVEGEEVDIYWLDDDNGKIIKALVFMGSRYICEAIAKPTYSRAKVEQGLSDQASREIMSAYVATIEAFGRKQTQLIEPVITVSHKPQPKQSFVMPGLNRKLVGNGEVLPEATEEDYEKFPPISFVKPISERW